MLRKTLIKIVLMSWLSFLLMNYNFLSTWLHYNCFFRAQQFVRLDLGTVTNSLKTTAVSQFNIQQKEIYKKEKNFIVYLLWYGNIQFKNIKKKLSIFTFMSNRKNMDRYIKLLLDRYNESQGK